MPCHTTNSVCWPQPLGRVRLEASLTVVNGLKRQPASVNTPINTAPLGFIQYPTPKIFITFLPLAIPHAKRLNSRSTENNLIPHPSPVRKQNLCDVHRGIGILAPILGTHPRHLVTHPRSPRVASSAKTSKILLKHPHQASRHPWHPF